MAFEMTAVSRSTFAPFAHAEEAAMLPPRGELRAFPAWRSHSMDGRPSMRHALPVSSS
jgi:hypothetical protein